MKCLVVAAGQFDDAMKADIAAGREPRLDVFQLADELGGGLVHFGDVERSTLPAVRLAARTAGKSAAAALLAFRERHRYDAIFTTGEDIGLPLSALLRGSSARCSHTMIAHTLFPRKKRLFFTLGGVASRVDRMLVYSTTEERLATETLGVPKHKVQRIAYHADDRFFRPDARDPEPDLICAAGQLLRDYDCLARAVTDLPIRVQIAAGSPWIEHQLTPRSPLPPNVSWGKLKRFELRELYARSALAVVPILQNHYQTGIATILEMMAMGKCVIATKTFGQTDTIVDGVTGVYVPPGDASALRQAIQRLLAAPDDARRMGLAARSYVEKNAGLDLFVKHLAQAIHAGHAERFS